MDKDALSAAPERPYIPSQCPLDHSHACSSADSPTIPAIILAAGGSTRLGQPKQLLRLKNSDETLLERAVRVANEAGATPIFVVLGAHAEAIQHAANLSQCIILLNKEWPEGMASSLRLGIAAAIEQAPAASGALLMVCDQPAISAEHLRRLLASHRAEPEIIAASHYAGRSGVPAVVPRAMFPALLAVDRRSRCARSLWTLWIADQPYRFSRRRMGHRHSGRFAADHSKAMPETGTFWLLLFDQSAMIRPGDFFRSVNWTERSAAVKKNVLPLFKSLSARMVPPWARMMCLAIDRPSPVPPDSRERPLSTR